MLLKNITEPTEIYDEDMDDYPIDPIELYWDKISPLLELEMKNGLKHRPKKPDVFNNVSINTPYYINLKEKKMMFTKYECDHVDALKSFDDVKLLARFNRSKYGWDKPTLYFYDNRCFNNALELELYVYAVEKNIEIERCPGYYKDMANGVIDHNMTYPDFRLGDRYICIEQSFLKKEDGTYKFPYPAEIVDGCEACHVEDMMNDRKKDILAVYPTCEFWSEKDFEEISLFMYDNYSDDYLPLFINRVPFPWPNATLRDTSPMGLVRHFHKSIMSARHGNEPTILELWNNKKIFKELALNRLLYVGECGVDRMRQGFNIAKIATKVSIFRSSLAAELISTYLYDAENIFDPFSGFSGRMLGAMLCNKPYIGRDVNAIHISESKQILEWWKHNRNPHVTVDLDVADAITNFGTYDCLLTCSPYAIIDRHGNKKNIETWNNPNQAVLTCDEWIDICLSRYKCRKYVFVVDDTVIKYRPYIVDVIGNKGHMGRNKEYVIFMDFTNYSLNVMNKGVTPYDIDQTQQYSSASGQGITPFDVPTLNK